MGDRIAGAAWCSQPTATCCEPAKHPSTVRQTGETDVKVVQKGARPPTESCESTSIRRRCNREGPPSCAG